MEQILKQLGLVKVPQYEWTETTAGLVFDDGTNPPLEMQLRVMVKKFEPAIFIDFIDTKSPFWRNIQHDDGEVYLFENIFSIIKPIGGKGHYIAA